MAIHLSVLTRECLKLNEEAALIFQEARESGMKGDFFSQVKPFADKMKEAAEQWGQEAIHWIEERRPKHLHAIQISNTVENLQMVSVRCHFPETSLKKFNSHIQSNDYILRSLLLEMDKSGNK